MDIKLDFIGEGMSGFFAESLAYLRYLEGYLEPPHLRCELVARQVSLVI